MFLEREFCQQSYYTGNLVCSFLNNLLLLVVTLYLKLFVF
ncbi:hypothetical protein B4071_4331 [Bacillus subtilis]|nr:hypothetical protein B4071_4331 [Bacillus subtilis]RPJ98067.1 hypothetical protein EH11_04147 [Bacillus subtilis]RUS03594.1 hypothetical protein EFW59_04191 [Bacillus subtilis]